MEQVKFIQRAPLCKDCVKEINNASRLKTAIIIVERKKHAKCNQCDRLYRLESGLNE
jgi:hypothetical protein